MTDHWRTARSAAPRSRVKAGVAALCVVVLALAAYLVTRGSARRGAYPLAVVDELVAPLALANRVDGRLTGGFRPAPSDTKDASRSPDQAPESLELVLAMTKVELTAREVDSPAADAALAIAALVKGEAERALHLLNAATEGDPRNAALWSDAAAGYLTLARRHDRPELAVRALAAAGQALALQGDLREARFNRALALAEVGLVEQAAAEWRNYLQSDDDAWSAQARAHDAALRAAIEKTDGWPAVREALAARADAHTSPRADDAAVITPFRQHVRDWIERDVLAHWGRAVLAGDAIVAAHLLRRARYAAQVLVLAGGDDQPRQGVEAIAALGDRVSPAAMAAAHLALADAMQFFDEGSVSAAAARFAEARPAFLAAHSSYAGWDTVYESVALYADRQLPRAFSVLEPAALDAQPLRFRYLQGRQAWLRALIRLHQGQLAAALDYYTAARDHFAAVGEVDSATAVSSLLGESLFSLGARSEAWRYQRDAVREVRSLTVPRRKHLVLLTAGLMCLDDGLPHAALAFQDAALAAAIAAGNRPSSLLNAYLQRARNRHTLGDLTGAADDLRNARDELPRVDDPLLRTRNEAEIWAATALVRRDTAPGEALAAATHAIGYFGQHDGRLFLPGLFLARARAARASGAVAQAEADAAMAIEAFEEQRGSVADSQYRETLFKDGWDAYDELIALRVARGNAGGALDVAERARARTLLEEVVAERAATPASVVALKRQLPADVAAVYFVSRPDRLWIWVITRDEIRFFDRPVSAAALRRAVERVRFDVGRDNTEAAVDRALQKLYRDIIEPLRDAVSPYPTLIVVPDGALHRLPFAALRRPASGRFLIEDHVIVVAPSFNIVMRAMDQGPARESRALVVANTARVVAPGIDLPELPSARAEALAIAALYGRGVDLLIDEQATPSAFRARLVEADIVHYAGHAWSDARVPERSRLFLRTTGGGDGALYASDLKGLRLSRHPVVVLASCSTHAGGIAIAEGLQSLARPFLGAGASAVVATLWDVRDSDARELFTAFHTRLAAGQQAAHAVASVQREAIGRDRSVAAASRWSWAVSIGGIVRQPVE